MEIHGFKSEARLGGGRHVQPQRLENFKSDARLGAMCSLSRFLYSIEQAFDGFKEDNANSMDINKQGADTTAHNHIHELSSFQGLLYI